MSTGIAPLGVVGDIQLVLPYGRNIIEFVECHCPWDVYVKGATIMIGDLDRLETLVVSAAMLQVLES